MKKGLKLFGMLFAIVILFGVTGCNKKTVDEPPIQNKPKENVIRLVSETKQIEAFNSMISQLKLKSDSKSGSYSVFSAVVSDDKIIAIFNSDKEEDRVTREITAVNNIASIDVSYENATGYIYVLTNSGEVYLIELTKTSDIKPLKYEISNVEALLGLYGDVEGNNVSQPIVIIRTKDKNYYTDYRFSNETERVLRQIIPPVQTTN